MGVMPADSRIKKEYVFMHIRNFCGALKLKVMTSYKELLLEMKPGFTTINQKQKKSKHRMTP